MKHPSMNVISRLQSMEEKGENRCHRFDVFLYHYYAPIQSSILPYDLLAICFERTNNGGLLIQKEMSNQLLGSLNLGLLLGIKNQ